MDLRNHQITVGEILSDPRAKAVLQQEVPAMAGMLNGPLARQAWNMPLGTALGFAGRYVPRDKLQHVLRRLEAL